MSNVIRNLLFATLPSLLAIFLVLELVFRFVIPAAEVPRLLYDGAHGIVRFDPEGPREGVFTRGQLAQLRKRWRINDDGWNSDVDYVHAAQRTRPLIAIIGDSFINSFQVHPEENIAAVLRDLLGGRFDVYRFGMSGSPLSQYLQVSRYVAAEFDPEILVFVLVYNDFHESVRELGVRPMWLQVARGDAGGFVEVPPSFPEAPRTRMGLSSSAIARYWQFTLRSTPIATLKHRLLGRTPPVYNANIPVDFVTSNREIVAGATRFILERIRAENPDRPVLFVMDAPRFDIYRDALEESNVNWLNDLARDECERLGLPFVDLRLHFSEFFHRTGRRLESEVDSHWNERGHAEAARALHQELRARRFVAPR